MPENNPEWHGFADNPWSTHCWVVGEPTVGDGCWVGAFTLLDGSGGLTIGSNCDISAGAQLYSHTTVRRVVSEGREDVERASTRIGDHVHIGAGAIILMGADIGSHSVVGAGAVVRQHTVAPAWSLLVGSPAEIVLDGARRFDAAVEDGTSK